MYSSEVVNTDTSISLRRCDVCLKGEQEGKLRKCAACSRVLYCSRACQKAGWSHHKLLCSRYSQEAEIVASVNEAEAFGYSSSAAFLQAVQQYRDTHRWAIAQAIHAVLMLETGDVSMAIALQQPRKDVLVFRLACQSSPNKPPSQLNPASTFRVIDFRLCPAASRSAEDVMQGPRQLDHYLGECDKEHKRNLEKEQDPCYVPIPFPYCTSSRACPPCCARWPSSGVR
ncbi:hypothetical protein C8Q77DRAFT_1249807 [Trametes polyzona]|nr:hypothetical protein C8Q77DRAFT_1249807 [Trametes polyzona]